MVADNSLHELDGAVDLDDENLLLLWTLTDEVRVKRYLRTWKKQTAERTLWLCCFLKRSPKSHVVADFAEMCETLVAQEVQERDGEYSKAIAILKSSFLATSERLPRLLARFLVILAEDRDLINDV